MKKWLWFALCIVLLLTATTVLSASGSVEGVFPRHEPYGRGIGAMPGRVVWAHEPQAVKWDGSGYWWETEHFDEKVIRSMVNQSVATLANQATAKDGWNALFTAHNRSRGKNGGYAAGEKIAIKANINGSAVNGNDTSGETQMSYTNPVLLKTLLVSLVEEGGVAPSDITVYDVSRLFPDYMVEKCTEGFLQGVRFIDRDNGTADEAAPIDWSHTFSGAVNYLPTCVTEAEYVINLANLKGHSYGITLCGKNHFGSFINGNTMRPPEGANLHQFLTRNEMGIYSPLVDLMANEKLGGKTVLYLLDALICAPSEGASITGDTARWQQSPFNGNYTASVFLSQDPVAMDSVGADFLINEPAVTSRNGMLKDNPNVENYLHEAGLVANPPSGTVYANGAGTEVTNLGVHEHWNNQADKQYSRNLGMEEGIELVLAQPQAGVSVEHNIVSVTNAPAGSTLIAAAYRGNTLSGVKLYRGSGTITADLAEMIDTSDKVKVFLWNMSTLEPLALPIERNTAGQTGKMTLHINGRSFTATLYDNETARAFEAMLPMTLEMNELNGNEKYHFLSGELPTASEQPSEIRVGDIMLYGSNCVVLFYKTFSSSYSYTRIGRIDDVAGLQEAVGSAGVTVQFE